MAILYNTVQSDNLQTSIGGVPGAGDSVILDRFSNRYTAGLALNANAIALWHIRPTCACTINDADYLQILATTGEFINEGSGESWNLRAGTSAEVIDKIRNNPVRGNSRLNLATLKSNYISNHAGVMNIADTVDTNGILVVTGGQVSVAYSATFLVDGLSYFMGGRTSLMRQCFGIVLGGNATVKLTEQLAAQGTVQMQGGTMVVESTGNWTSFDGNAGVLDLTRNSRPWTVTTWFETPALTILKSRRTVEPTITNPILQTFGKAKTIYVD